MQLGSEVQDVPRRDKEVGMQTAHLRRWVGAGNDRVNLEIDLVRDSVMMVLRLLLSVVLCGPSVRS